MVPDKIYISKYNINVKTGYFSRNKDDVFTQEYIRKDALLEWLKEVKADPMIPMNIDNVIKKIESL